MASRQRVKISSAILQALYDANLAALRDGKRLSEVRGISFTYPPMTPTRFNLGSVSIVIFMKIKRLGCDPLITMHVVYRLWSSHTCGFINYCDFVNDCVNHCFVVAILGPIANVNASLNSVHCYNPLLDSSF